MVVHLLNVHYNIQVKVEIVQLVFRINEVKLIRFYFSDKNSIKFFICKGSID